MSTLTIVLISITVFLLAVVVALYFFGKRTQKKQEAQQAQIDAAKQSVTMLIIDKKRMKIKDSGLPAAVIAQTPRLLRGSKLSIVKAKVGPQMMTLVCDDKIFDIVPTKKEVKAVVSGIYITDVKGLRGGVLKADKKKKGFLKNALEKAQEKVGAKPIK
ncbi:MAG TPA: hypothetical protein PLU43_03190 [Lachnospiraceae bacterium]|nr:hypothetical protein [Lachnospiraceae bacterium]